MEIEKLLASMEHFDYDDEEGINEFIEDNPHTVEALVAALKNDDNQERFDVAAALGKIRDSRAEEALISTALKDRDLEVRVEAGYWLIMRGSPRTMEIIKKMIKDKERVSRIKLESMSEEQLKIETETLLENTDIYIDEYVNILLILSDGEPMIGSISHDCFDFPDALIIHCAWFSYLGDMEHYICVPLDRIAGISMFNYEQDVKKKKSKGAKGFGDEVRGIIAEETLRKADQMQFLVGYHEPGHPCATPLILQWGKTNFHSNTPLFCDWEYLVRKSNGLNSLGVGFIGLSVSAGWSKSLWSSFQKQVSKTNTKIEDICESSEATISGYVTFFDTVSKKKQKALDDLYMEGVNWIPGVITESVLDSISDLKRRQWIICYFRDDAFMYPSSLWGNIEVPVKIFGEIVETPIVTEFGSVKCFMKARVGAYLSDE